MESYFILIGIISLLIVLASLPILILKHKQNKEIINAHRMYSRELAEALTGKKIDWDN